MNLLRRRKALTGPAPLPGGPALDEARVGPRGLSGRGRGYASYLQAPPEWRATTVQACGLWPFAAGTGTPMIGVPLGLHMGTHATVCCDPLSWFSNPERALISNPSVFVLGKPGLGKSTVIRRMALGLTGFGTLPMILGDLKPDYVDLIEAMNGQVIRVGPGAGHINVLDPGESAGVAQRLTGTARATLEHATIRRRHHMVASLIAIIRHGALSDREDTILARAVQVLDERFDTHGGARQPLLADLLQVIQDAPAAVREVAVDRNSRARYDELTEGLEASLMGLIGGGRLGATFSRPTTTPMLRDRPVAFDVSGVTDRDAELQAAVLMACWSEGFAAIDSAHALADAGLEPERHYFVVMDELWRALKSGSGMVQRMNSLTRLNRNEGIAQAMITHTMNDLRALATEEDRESAKTFVDRAGMVITAGLPASEMPALTSVFAFSEAEKRLVTSWVDPGGWGRGHGGAGTAPPGVGNFLIKVGGQPGIPVHVRLTEAELAFNDTNKRWKREGSVAAAAEVPA